MTHGGNAIWGGSRVRLTDTHIRVAKGSEGVNVGQRQGGNTLVRLDDGREIYLPITLLTRVDKEKYVPDAITWKPFPETRLHHPHFGDRVLSEERSGDYAYRLRGHTGKWYVTRTHYYHGTTERTKFYPNQRLAKAAYDHIVNDA